MAYKQISPINVVEGGTGAITLTDHGVLVGSGTSSITALTVGTDGQVIVGSTGADPVFATIASSDSLLTLTGGSGTLDITANQAVSSSSTITDYAVVCGDGGTRGVQSIAGVGTSGQVLTSNGAGMLPTFQNSASGGDVSGPGSSTDNALARWDGTSGTLLQDSTVIVSDAGEMTNASQPAFLGYQGTQDDNETGDGTLYFLGDTDVGTTLTEVFDQGGDFSPGASGGAIFTAPIDGRYYLNCGYNFAGLTSSHTNGSLNVVTSNRAYRGAQLNWANGRTDINQFVLSSSFLADMDLGDTARTFIGIFNGTKVVDIAASDAYTFFSGYLVC